MSHEQATAVQVPLRRIGECTRCGECCMVARMRLQKSAVGGGDEVTIRDLARWLSLRPYVHVFEDDVSLEVGIDIPCKFLGRDKDGKAVCGLYENRPLICREFPRRPSAMCKGFKFVPVDSGENT